LLLGGAQVVSDPNFEYITLLLPGNGTNGAQNNTFLDSSTNNFTITRNGNTTQGTFSPFSQTGWGNFFDGTGDWISAPSNAVFDFSGDFTIELWFYATTVSPSFQGFCGRRLSAANFGPFSMGLSGASIIFSLSTSGSSWALNSTGGTVTANSWNHVAFVRSGTACTAYLNGTSVITGTVSGALASSSQNLAIGTFTNDGTEAFNGYISSLRVVKGTAVYTANFTPPTAPLTAITNTSLLTCQSNRFVDNSTNAFAITRNGDVSVQAFSPFNPTAAWSAATYGGSGYFDGSGDFLTTSSSAVSYTGDFCIEFWFYTNTTTTYASFYSDEGPSGGLTVLINNASNNGQITVYAGAISNFASTKTGLNNSAWHHFALTRSGSTVRMFVDGALENTTTASGTIATPATVRIGSSYFVSRDYLGYISGFRFVNGSAVYTAAFTPPTAPPTAITNTSLLLNYTNAGIYDATSKNNLETVGNAQISTTQSKFGGSSMAFDGNGDFLRSPFSQINRINTTGNFTIEFWAYFNSVAADQRLIGWDNNTNNFVIAIYTNTSGNLAYYLSSTGTTWNIAQAVTMGSIAINNWYHVALVRNGSTFTPYINGVAGTTTTSSATLTASTLPLTIGAVGSVASFFNGYINDFRITNGIARYTAAFTPPTAAFPIQ
jgi:hypothetical protein